MHVYTDGTVLVTHGGVEMGQGLHTKVAQIAAAALGLPLSAVFIAETATDKVPNASSTAASASSDLYGAAGEVWPLMCEFAAVASYLSDEGQSEPCCVLQSLTPAAKSTNGWRPSRRRRRTRPSVSW